jgi:hypothetical protein
MKSTAKTTVRQVSANTYRVSGSAMRSAVTGKFVSTANATRQASPQKQGSAAGR